jgi:hypothetical protein
MAHSDEPFWQDSAEDFGNFLGLLPGLNPYDLGDDPQKTLADYVGPPGYCMEEFEAQRVHYATMERATFRTIYATFVTRLRRVE